MGSDSYQELKSVGIDIGTTTTQIIISHLAVKNVAPGTLVPRMQITDKVVVYKSDIYFTPMKDKYLIDAEKLSELIRLAYQKAGVNPGEIDTGAVIITGETAKKENARLISEQIAGLAGDFVVATAGGNLESIIAGKGSGAADYSKNHFSTVANIDIGGGTSNIAVFKNGKAIDFCCINIGGRLMQIDRETEKLTLLTEPMESILSDLNVHCKIGDILATDILKRVCSRMAQVLIECISSSELGTLSKRLMMTEPLNHCYELDTVMISGGVADYVYRNENLLSRQDIFKYGDIGPLLGQEVQSSFLQQGYSLTEPSETIRATVIGAGARTVDVSGSTIIVAESRLPLKNIPVVKPLSDEFLADSDHIAEKVKRSVASYFGEESVENVAVAIQTHKQLTFSEIQILAEGLLGGLEDIIKLGLPVIVIVNQDCAKVLGQSMKAKSNLDSIICIDQIEVNEGDYIDIGKSIAGGTVVPVIIKTLIFETKQL